MIMDQKRGVLKKIKTTFFFILNDQFLKKIKKFLSKQ